MDKNERDATRDSGDAAKLYRQKAEQGDAQAQYRLGNCYAKGRGVAQNRVEAAKWLRLAAERGNEKAREMLNEMNAPADPAQASSE